MNATKILVPLSLIVISGFCGYQLGSKTSSEAESKSQQPVSPPQPGSEQSTITESSPRFAPHPTESNQAKRQMSALDVFQTQNQAERFALAKEYFSNVSLANVERYLDELEQLPPSANRTQLMGQFFSQWGAIEGDVAYNYALALTGRDRGQFLAQAAAGWAKSEPEIAWGAIMEATANGKSYAIPFHRVLDAIAENDLRQAFIMANGVESRSGMVSYGGTALSNHALAYLIHNVSQKGNFQELTSIILEENDPSEVGKSLEALFGTWGKYEFEGPLSAIKELESAELSNQAMTGFMKGWAQADGSEAFQYAIANQSNQAIAAALPDIASTWLRSATAPEIEGIVSQLNSVQNRDEIIAKIIHPVANVKPSLAMDLAMSSESQKSRIRSARSVTYNWARQNLKEADAYVRSIDDTKIRSAVASGLVSQHLQQESEPQKLLSLVDSFEDKQSRKNLLNTIIGNATSSRYKSKSQAVIEALRQDISTRPDFSDDERQRTLDKLNNKQ